MSVRNMANSISIAISSILIYIPFLPLFQTPILQGKSYS